MYVKQNFQDGQILTGEMMRKIEDALFDVCGDMEAAKAFIQKHGTVETGSVSLTNSSAFPFNGSKKTVSLQNRQANGDYIVLTELDEFVGNVGEIVVSAKMTNGFSIAFTGSATSATIDYIVIGGFSE